MLVHHADAGPDGVLGRGELDRLSVQEDLALVVPVQAVEDVHERGLARSVLAQEGVHLAAFQVEIDSVVGDDAGEAFRDRPELEDGDVVSHVGILGGRSDLRPPSVRPTASEA